MLLLCQARVHELVLEVKLEHLLVAFLQHRVDHVREHILLNKLLLFLCRLLLLEGFELVAHLVFRSLDERVPEELLLVKFALVGRQEVVE